MRKKSPTHVCLPVGKDLTLTQQYAAIGALSFPLLWISGAGGAVFWILGKSIQGCHSLHVLQDWMGRGTLYPGYLRVIFRLWHFHCSLSKRFQ